MPSARFDNVLIGALTDTQIEGVAPEVVEPEKDWRAGGAQDSARDYDGVRSRDFPG